jgi:hypothetical protein
MALLVLYGKLVRHGGGHFDACRKKVSLKTTKWLASSYQRNCVTDRNSNIFFHLQSLWAVIRIFSKSKVRHSFMTLIMSALTNTKTLNTNNEFFDFTVKKKSYGTVEA